MRAPGRGRPAAVRAAHGTSGDLRQQHGPAANRGRGEACTPSSLVTADPRSAGGASGIPLLSGRGLPTISPRPLGAPSRSRADCYASGLGKDTGTDSGQGGRSMPMVVNTNIQALNAQRNLSVTNAKMSKALEKLSSGLRINRAADDAAG